MTTMTVNIENYADVNYIAAVVSRLNGVAELKVHNETKKKSFEEACIECNAVPVKTFTDELRRQIDEYFDTCAQ